MARTVRPAQAGREPDRAARLVRARQRRMALDQDRDARDARIDEAMADIYLAQDQHTAATAAMADADALAAEGIGRLMAEGLVLAQVVELTELPARQVQRLRAAADASSAADDPAAANRAADEASAVAVGPAKG